MSFGYITPSITKWKLQDFIGTIEEFEDELCSKVNHNFVIGYNYETILLHMIGKSILTTKEILTLCAHGYSDGALSLGRNLYEQMIIINFFEMHKKDEKFAEYVNNFILNYEVQINKYMRSSAKYNPEIDISSYDNEIQTLKNRTSCKFKNDYWWSECENFSKLVDVVMDRAKDERTHKFLGTQYMRYKRACVSLHASFLGNSNRIGHDTGVGIIDTNPDLNRQGTALLFAIVSIIDIIGKSSVYFEIDSYNYLKTLNQLAVFYQREENSNSHND